MKKFKTIYEITDKSSCMPYDGTSEYLTEEKAIEALKALNIPENEIIITWYNIEI